MNLKVRPFERIIERFGSAPAIRASGQIVKHRFALHIDAAVYPLPTVGTGTDKWGDYALIQTGEMDLGDGFTLRISGEYDEDSPGAEPGCEISLERRGDPRKARAALDREGIDPSSVNLLVPPEASVSVYFNSLGLVDGGGSLSPAVDPDELQRKPHTH